MTVDDHGQTLNANTGAGTGKQGMKFTTRTACILDAITKSSAQLEVLTAYLQDSAGTGLASAAFSGDVATFNYTLADATQYRAVVDENGGSFITRKKDPASPTMPITQTNIVWDSDHTGDTLVIRAIQSLTTTAIVNVTVTPSTLTLSTTAQTPTIIVLIIPSTLTLTAAVQAPAITILSLPDAVSLAVSAKDVFVLETENYQIVVGTGTKSTRFLANRYPVTSGLTAGTTKTEGRVTALIPSEGSNIPGRNKAGL